MHIARGNLAHWSNFSQTRTGCNWCCCSKAFQCTRLKRRTIERGDVDDHHRSITRMNYPAAGDSGVSACSDTRGRLFMSVVGPKRSMASRVEDCEWRYDQLASAMPLVGTESKMHVFCFSFWILKTLLPIKVLVIMCFKLHELPFITWLLLPKWPV